ncbi:MAG: tyrosine-type recombinase/integrase [Verrucomicrobiales bacterium]
MPKHPSFKIRQAHDRAKPYYFEIPATRSASGKRQRFFFGTRKEAETAVELEKVRISNFGTMVVHLPAEVRREAVRAQEILEPLGIGLREAAEQVAKARRILDPINANILEAAEQYFQHQIEMAKSCTFAGLLQDFLASKEREGVSSAYRSQIKGTLNRMLPRLGERIVSTISTKDLSTAIDGLKASPASTRAHLRVLRAAFNFGIDRDYLTTNPVSKIKPPKQKTREVHILSNEQCRALLHAAQNNDPELLPYFALGLFAGLRPTEAQHLDWKEVELERKRIFVRNRAANIKEQIGRFVPIENCLQEWLKGHIQTSGRLTPVPNFRKRFAAVRSWADEGLKKDHLENEATLSEHWTPDCMRHTAASNWDALRGTIAETCMWLGHSERIHRKHYYRPLPWSNAEAFWNIRPESNR